MAVLGVSLLFLCVIGVAIIITIFTVLRSYNRHFSQETVAKQRMFVFSLLAQVFVIFVCICLPFAAFLIAPAITMPVQNLEGL